MCEGLGLHLLFHFQVIVGLLEIKIREVWFVLHKKVT